MDRNFITLIQKIIDERGKSTLENEKLTRALFMDYSHGKYKHEINFLLKLIDLGVYKEIMESRDLDNTKYTLVRRLCNELYFNEKISAFMVILLISLLRDKKYLNEIDKDNNQNNPKTLRQNKNIIKLIENGWSVEEISRTLKLPAVEIQDIIHDYEKREMGKLI